MLAKKRGEAPPLRKPLSRGRIGRFARRRRKKGAKPPPWEHIYYGENANPIDLMSALAYNIGKTGLKSEPWFVFVGGVG